MFCNCVVYAIQLREEIVRCEQLKLQNIQQSVEAKRKELVSWWDRCFVLPENRAAFKPFYQGTNISLLSTFSVMNENYERKLSDSELIPGSFKQEAVIKKCTNCRLSGNRGSPFLNVIVVANDIELVLDRDRNGATIEHSYLI